MMRRAADPDDHLVCIFNFTPVPRGAYRIGVPAAGTYNEVFNSDAALYGGSGVGNGGSAPTTDVAAHRFDQSLLLTIPPLGCLVFKPTREGVGR